MRRGDWVQTYTGKVFWPLDPRPEEVDIRDIAHSLSLQCRYTGHTREFYSVAQHSILVASLAEQLAPGSFLAGLMHDAAEAYFGDVARPIKRCIPEISQYEEQIQRCIFAAFDLDWPLPPEVKIADEILLSTERRDLMADCPREWGGLVEPQSRRIVPCSAIDAEREFLHCFNLEQARAGSI